MAERLAELRVGRARRGGECARAIRPATLLDATDRDLELRARRDQDRALEDPVLLRADELLALVEEGGGGEGVRDKEGLDRAGLVELGDGEAAGEGFVQADESATGSTSG
jgi:hypothetical protein